MSNLRKNLSIESARKSSCVDDVFFNEFDLSWFRGTTEKVLTRAPSEPEEIDDGSFTYVYNNEFFRSDDFTASHTGSHVLFAGCSQTEGIGSPLDTVWSKMLHNQLSANNDVSGFYTIARSGFGWQKIISNFMIYADKYGMPDYMFVMVPDLCRFFEWWDEKSAWVYVQRIVGDDAWAKNQGIDSIFYQQATEKEYKKAVVDFKISWNLFEKYCELNNVKLLWGTWEYEDSNLYKNLIRSKHYVDLSYDGFMDYVSNNRPDGKLDKFDLSRRDGHAGILQHEYWLSEFKKEISERGWMNV